MNKNKKALDIAIKSLIRIQNQTDDIEPPFRQFTQYEIVRIAIETLVEIEIILDKKIKYSTFVWQNPPRIINNKSRMPLPDPPEDL